MDKQIVMWLPNRSGNQVETVVPKYIYDILMKRCGSMDVPRIQLIGSYRYRLRGHNPQRPAYGIRADIEKLGDWTARYFSPIEDIRFHEKPKDYYVDFTLYDPVSHQIDKHILGGIGPC